MVTSSSIETYSLSIDFSLHRTMDMVPVFIEMVSIEDCYITALHEKAL